MTYEDICNLKKGEFPKTFRELSTQIMRVIVTKDTEEPLTNFMYDNQDLYDILKEFDYDRDKIASMITQVALTYKVLLNSDLNDPSISYGIPYYVSYVITIPCLLLSSKDEDGTFYQHNPYIDIVKYYYIVVHVLNLKVEIEHNVLDVAKTILNELMHYSDKFTKVILKKPTDSYNDLSTGCKALITEKPKRDEYKTSALSFEKLVNDLGVDDISIIHDFPVLPQIFNNFPFDRLKVIKFLSDYLYEPIVQRLEFAWIDSIVLTPINILSDDTVQKGDDYFDMMNYYYIMENITASSNKGNIQKLSYIIRDIRNMLQYHSNTFAVNSNTMLVPVKRKDDYSALFREVTFIRRDINDQLSERSMFYKLEEVNDSNIRYSIFQVQNIPEQESEFFRISQYVPSVIIKNPKYKNLILKPIFCDETNIWKYEVIFGMKKWSRYDELSNPLSLLEINRLTDKDCNNQSIPGEDVFTSNRYLIWTYLHLEKDYYLDSIELKQNDALKRILEVSHSRGPQNTIQMEIEWPFGIESLNAALRNGYLTFILTITRE